MEIDDVRLFVRVVEGGDFSVTARRMDLSPSTVSKAMARLERRLGVRLFHRSPRSMQLTAEGEMFQEAALRLLAVVEEAEAVGSAEPAGLLRVKSLPSFAIYKIAPLLPIFLAQHPKLDIEFNLTNENNSRLDDGTDIAIVSGTPKGASSVTRRISSSRWIICASPSYLAAHGTPGTVDDLRFHTCLNFSMTTEWNDWALATPKPLRTIAANQGDMLLSLARAGAGIARLALYHAEEALERGELLHVLPELENPVDEPIHAVFHNKRFLSPRVRVFLDFLVEEFEKKTAETNL